MAGVSRTFAVFYACMQFHGASLIVREQKGVEPFLCKVHNLAYPLCLGTGCRGLFSVPIYAR